jgi:AcrR family transcriptional regulator
MNLRERKKVAAWRVIRAAALRLFDEQGFDATTVEQIAAEAGISRATFFNYFPSKEAVVFDQDLEEREGWRALLDARPADEPLWDSLTTIAIGYGESLRERLPMQRRLKQRFPALAQSGRTFGAQFVADVRDWVAARSGLDDMSALLQLNVVMAATSTAYQTWGAEESFDDYLVRLRTCLQRARPAVGT